LWDFAVFVWFPCATITTKNHYVQKAQRCAASSSKRRSVVCVRMHSFVYDGFDIRQKYMTQLVWRFRRWMSQSICNVIIRHHRTSQLHWFNVNQKWQGDQRAARRPCCSSLYPRSRVANVVRVKRYVYSCYRHDLFRWNITFVINKRIILPVPDI